VSEILFFIFITFSLPEKGNVHRPPSREKVSEMRKNPQKYLEPFSMDSRLGVEG